MIRILNIVFFSIAIIVLMGASNTYAQRPLVLIPNPVWPLDSVVNGSVHFYTVPGDTNYSRPSTFVWTVLGGRLFTDSDTLSLAGNGTTASVPGDSLNVTRMWVVWDTFKVPIDTGYIYVYEISADSCQRPDSDAGKFQGMQIEVIARPTVRFITPEAIVCSNFDSARVILEITGMAPYDFVFSLNGEVHNWHLERGDLTDIDGDGKINNLSFFYSDLDTLTSDMVYSFQLISITSDDVNGYVLGSPTFDLIIHVQPPAPVIRHEWTEVTVGTTHTYHFDDPGVNPDEWFWYLRDVNTNLVNEYSSKIQPDFTTTFNNSPPGLYYFEAQYRDKFYGCYSPWDSLNIEVFAVPTIAFSDSTPDVINCSATMPLPDGQFPFVVEYTGVTKYGYTYEVYNYYNNVPEYTGVIDSLTNRSDTIYIDNMFINNTDRSQPWRVVITEAHNEEGVNVNIIKGREKRIIWIYPKPIIYDDIDFAN